MGGQEGETFLAKPPQPLGNRANIPSIPETAARKRDRRQRGLVCLARNCMCGAHWVAGVWAHNALEPRHRVLESTPQL